MSPSPLCQIVKNHHYCQIYVLLVESEKGWGISVELQIAKIFNATTGERHAKLSGWAKSLSKATAEP